MASKVGSFRWVGSEEAHLDNSAIATLPPLVIGRYGGNTAAGAVKNEDGALIYYEPGGLWEFCMLLDAHSTAESAELLLESIGEISDEIEQCLSRPSGEAFRGLEALLLDMLSSEAFRSRCREVTGETACLICARKDQYLWWFSAGDNSVYLFHPDLAARGQYLLNQRNYYEWIGYVNTFEQPVPCYSSGVREFRTGRNVIVMTTDGLLEYGSLQLDQPTFADAHKLYRTFYDEKPIVTCVEEALTEVHTALGRDSATVIAWSCNNQRPAAQPSDA